MGNQLISEIDQLITEARSADQRDGLSDWDKLINRTDSLISVTVQLITCANQLIKR